MGGEGAQTRPPPNKPRNTQNTLAIGNTSTLATFITF